jgi:hypothetical protein
MAISVEYLVVGGGGGGAPNGGGGGGGGFRTGTNFAVASATPISITVGTGGAGGTTTNNGVAGTDSIFSTITATGGGYGTIPLTANAGSGGSGGGCGYGSSTTVPTTGGSGNTPSTSPSQGNNGGGGLNGTTNGAGGGGGGAGAVGGNATSPGASPTGGVGGTGLSSSITGTLTFYAGGGGGGGYGGSAGGAGGAGGGGGGSSGTSTSGTGGSNGGFSGGLNAAGGAGGLNSGGGGGGGAITSGAGQSNAKAGGKGGDGVVIIRYLTSAVNGASGGTATTDGSYTVRTFTSSGTLTLTEIIAGQPVNTVAPVISGTVGTIGNTFTCTQGTWTGDATISYAYQWYRSGTAINGATTNTYTLNSLDSNTTLTCIVSATNSVKTLPATSNAIFIWFNGYLSLQLDTYGYTVNSQVLAISSVLSDIAESQTVGVATSSDTSISLNNVNTAVNSTVQPQLTYGLTDNTAIVTGTSGTAQTTQSWYLS